MKDTVKLSINVSRETYQKMLIIKEKTGVSLSFQINQIIERSQYANNKDIRIKK